MKPTVFITLATICYIQIFLGVITNGSLLVIFIRSKRLRSIPSNKLICSLLFSDLLIELGFAFTIPITAESLAQKIAFLLSAVAMTLTVLNLCSIWIDRIVTLKMSFRHHRIINNKRVAKILIATWSVGITLAITSIVMFSCRMDTTAYQKWRYVSSIMTFVGFFVLMIANAIIFCEARKQACKINRTTTRLRRNFLTLQLKSTYMCISMVTAFLVFWLPYLIENLRVLVHGKNNCKGTWFHLFCASMTICNTVINPCLYVLLNRDTRKFIIQRWRRSRSKNVIKRPVESQKSLTSVVTISMRQI